MRRFLAVPLLSAVLAASAFAQNSAPNVQEQLQQIMQMLQEQQKQIQALQSQVLKQQESLDLQQERIIEQNEQLARQREIIDEQPNLNDVTEAWVHYKTGAELQHKARFDVRKRDARGYYRKAIEEYLTVVEQHPNTPPASECAYRIGQIYHRYLKEYDRAREYYNLYLERYPNSDKNDEVREGLGDLKGQ